MSVPAARSPRRAEILAVGSELLTPFKTDSNSLFLTARLNEIGIPVFAKFIVGDDRDDLAAFIRTASERADLVILTGGLGPTEDDVTRLAASDALQLSLDEDARIVERIEARFAARGLAMPAINRRQAEVLRGAEVLPNPHGTAPGQWLERDGRILLLLPGPPREMQPMFERVLEERLLPRAGGARIYRRVLQIAGRAESAVEQVAQPIYSTWRNWTPAVSTSILASPGQVELHFSVQADSAEHGQATLDRAEAEMMAALGHDVYSTDGRRLEEVVGAELQAKGLTVACAESCTGGLVTSRLTDVAGSSVYVDRAVVTYSNRAKVELLGVPQALLDEHGAVSEPVAVAMAEGMRRRSGVDVAIAVTGIAGPGGGTPTKPVGTVCIAVSSAFGHRAQTFQFPGNRTAVKFQSSQMALVLLRRHL